ncbi:hypothetical protein AcV5_002980 [Taiwanofungus camphoratus]|nr:hypothetical protein AcV5_002980 [Antrodia cinnamomea]
MFQSSGTNLRRTRGLDCLRPYSNHDNGLGRDWRSSIRGARIKQKPHSPHTSFPFIMAVAACEISQPSLLRPQADYIALPQRQHASRSRSQSLRNRSRPLPNSYWATPYLVACEFPYCPLTPTQMAHKQTKQKLDALLLAGVRTFIDLTEPHELFPYSPHLAARCALLGIEAGEVEYHNFPIRDRSVPASVEVVREIMAVLRDNERRARVSAVHCRGGIGRTGLVVGCWLVESGIARDGADALRLIAEEWKTVEKCKRFPCSPETGPQFEFVRNFKRAGTLLAAH